MPVNAQNKIAMNKVVWQLKANEILKLCDFKVNCRFITLKIRQVTGSKKPVLICKEKGEKVVLTLKNHPLQ